MSIESSKGSYMEKFRVAFIVPGEPKGKGRPRFNTKTGKTYTPGDTINYENLVKLQYQSLVGDKYTEKPIEAIITCYYSIPKSMSKANKEKAYHGKLRPTKKPDLDNVAKVVLDSLNGLAYKDDSQVVSLKIDKYYADKPLVKVELYEVEYD